MTEHRSALGRQPEHIDLSPGDRAGDDARTMILVIYGLYLAGFVSGGLTAIVGVVLAYMARGSAPAWAESHYDFQIRTFWLFLVAVAVLVAFALVSVVLTLVLVGILGLLLLAPFSLALAVWYGLRCAVGFNHALSSRPYPNPRGWML